MLVANSLKYRLFFKQKAVTSRNILKYKDSWFLIIHDISKPNAIGIGEISIIEGLSIENANSIDYKLKWLCKNINLNINELYSSLIEFPSIRFALETAIYDLQNGGKRVIFDSDFVKSRKMIKTNGLIWIDSKERMLKQIDEKVNSGFNTIKIKIGYHKFNDELAILKFIRKHYKRNIELRLDANGAFAINNALNILNKLEHIDIHSIEQPIAANNIDAMAILCLKSPIAIALDEELIGVNFYEDKKLLLETIRPHYIILKPSLIGGFKSADEWISIADKLNIKWWATSALESNIGLNAIAQWLDTKNNNLPQGLGTGSLFYNNIISPLTIKQGELYYNKNKKWIINNLENNYKNCKITIDSQLFENEEYIKKAFELKTSKEQWLNNIGNIMLQWSNNNDVIIFKTSGTTGKPKIVKLKKEALLHSALATAQALKLKEGDTAFLCLSAQYIAGAMMIIRAITLKLNLLIAKPTGNPLVSGCVENKKIDFTAFVPTQLYNILLNKKSLNKLQAIDNVIIGGAELSNELEAKIKSFKNKIFLSFGMTETASHIALRLLSQNNSNKHFSTLSNIKIEADSRNCLIIKHPYITDNILVTNDLIKIIDDNKFIWLGRIDNLINKGGVKLIPEIIEQKISSHIKINFFVYKQNDEKYGEIPIIILETIDNKVYNNLFLYNINTLLNKDEQISTIYFCKNFNKNKNGKVNRFETIKNCLIL